MNEVDILAIQSVNDHSFEIYPKPNELKFEQFNDCESDAPYQGLTPLYEQLVEEQASHSVTDMPYVTQSMSNVQKPLQRNYSEYA